MENSDKEYLVERLVDYVESMKTTPELMDDHDHVMKTGVLISGNEALIVLELIRRAEFSL